MEEKRIDYKQAKIYTIYSNIDGVTRKYKILKSYATIIAIFNTDKTNEIYKNENYYSMTTSRHYNRFLDIIGYHPTIINQMTEQAIADMFYDLQKTEDTSY